MSAANLSGVLVATVTPFAAGGNRLDLEFIPEHLRFLEREGVQGIVPVGTNGEFPSLSLAEKKEVLAVAAAARGSLALIAGVGSCCLEEVLDLVEYAAEVGADAALLVPPFYFSDVSASGVAEFYRRVLTASDLPVMLYNIPQYSGVPVTEAIIEQLLEFPHLAGIKDSSGDMERTRSYVEKYPQLKVFGGSDSRAGEILKAGAAGVISGIGNVFPGLLRQLWEKHIQGQDLSIAADRVKAPRQVFKAYPWIAATKYGLKLRGLPETFVRPPLLDLTTEQKQEMEKSLAELGLL